MDSGVCYQFSQAPNRKRKWRTWSLSHQIDKMLTLLCRQKSLIYESPENFWLIERKIELDCPKCAHSRPNREIERRIKKIKNLGCDESWVTRLGSIEMEEPPVFILIRDPRPLWNSYKLTQKLQMPCEWGRKNREIKVKYMLLRSMSNLGIGLVERQKRGNKQRKQRENARKRRESIWKLELWNPEIEDTKRDI